MTGIRTPVYHEAMAMSLAERALTIDAGNQQALGLWLASNLRREIHTPQGYENPAYAADRRDAMYFAVAAGAGPSQAVLARAVDAKDTMLARKAISAIERTAGSGALTAKTGDRSPLVEALTYPNRRVQYEAALALGASQPSAPFAGSERVVPTLAATIREASAKYAGIIARDNEQYQAIRKILEQDGYTVLSRGSSLTELDGPIAEVPALITSIRGTTRTAATPLLALTTAESYPELRRRYETETNVTVRPLATAPEAISKAANDLVLAASGGPIASDEAQAYAARSLAVLRDLAVSRNTALPVEEAVMPLIKSLTESTGTTKMNVAEVLSLIGQQRAQVSLMDAALNASGSDRIDLMSKVAGSAKRFGNQLEERQVRRVVEMAKGSDAAESTAAAALAGALNLPNADLIQFILGGRSHAAK
jgi:hypothetical protein